MQKAASAEGEGQCCSPLRRHQTRLPITEGMILSATVVIVSCECYLPFFALSPNR